MGRDARRIDNVREAHPIHLDLSRGADLRWPEPRRITKACRTLQEAVRGSYRLPEGQQVRATVVLRGDGMPVVHKAAEIRRSRAMALEGAPSMAAP